jgi:outer membrane protein insertion porin family
MNTVRWMNSAGVGGDAQYVKTEISVKGYTTLFSDDVIGSLELAGGAINSFGGYDLKASDRFFLGGDSLRGFESAGIGPRDEQTDDTLGGNYYGVARAEVTFPLGLPEEYGLAGGIFGDVGTVWELDKVTYSDTDPRGVRPGALINSGNPVTIDDSAKLRAAVGATIFWTSPFGPVRLNFAAPILKEDNDDDEFFRFSAGTRF